MVETFSRETFKIKQLKLSVQPCLEINKLKRYEPDDCYKNFVPK